jgi:hypothetical protein
VFGGFMLDPRTDQHFDRLNPNDSKSLTNQYPADVAEWQTPRSPFAKAESRTGTA